MSPSPSGRLIPLVKQSPLLFRTAQMVQRGLRESLGALHLAPQPPPELEQQARQIIARSAEAKIRLAANGPRVLFFSLRAWPTHLAWETTIAHGLMQRGAQCEFFLCSREQPACDVLNWHDRSPATCDLCARFTQRLLGEFNLPYRLLRDFVTQADLVGARAAVDRCPPADYESFVYKGLPLGNWVEPSLARFLLTGSLGRDPASRAVYRDFLVSAILITEAGGRLLDAYRPDIVFMLNGLFFAERIMLELAHQRGSRVVTYEVGFMDNTIIFAHERPVVDLEIPKLWAEARERPLTPPQADRLEAYLESRRRGTKSALVEYWPSIQEDWQSISQTLGLDSRRKLVTLLTNIMWDTAIYRKDVGFRGMFDWITNSIDYFADRPDVQLVIRVHPAEVRLVGQQTRERVQDLIRQRYPQLPPNVVVVPPTSDISSYVLMRLSALGLVYTSTTGLEMALMGIPVIVSGETHYWRKGFTYDAQSPQEYRALIEDLLADGHRPNRERHLELARRYAHAFFFRFMIPFPLVSHLGRNVNRYNYTSLADLAPGKDPSLDLICSGILEGKEFALGDEVRI